MGSNRARVSSGEAQIARHYAQPGCKSCAPLRLEFQQATESIVCKFFADVQIAIGSRVLAGGADASGLVQNRAIYAEELCPAFTRIRRTERLEKRRNIAIAHSSLPGVLIWLASVSQGSRQIHEIVGFWRRGLKKTVFAFEPIKRGVPTTITKITASSTAYSAMSCPLHSTWC